MGGGAIMAPIGASIAVPMLTPVFFLAWFGGFYFGLRKLFKSRARKRAEALQKVFGQVEAEVAKKLDAT